MAKKEKKDAGFALGKENYKLMLSGLTQPSQRTVAATMLSGRASGVIFATPTVVRNCTTAAMIQTNSAIRYLTSGD